MAERLWEKATLASSDQAKFLLPNIVWFPMALLGVVPVICEQSEKYGHENRDSKVMSDSVCKQAYDNCWKYGWDSLQYILPSEHTDDLI